LAGKDRPAIDPPIIQPFVEREEINLLRWQACGIK
jgi:hypothetical protein